MSSNKFVDLFFQTKYIDWDEYLDKISELEQEYYGIEPEAKLERKNICG